MNQRKSKSGDETTAVEGRVDALMPDIRTMRKSAGEAPTVAQPEKLLARALNETADQYEYPLFFLLGGALHHPRRKKQGWLMKEQVLALEPVVTYPGNLMLEHLAKFGLKKACPETVSSRKEVLERLGKWR